MKGCGDSASGRGVGGGSGGETTAGVLVVVGVAVDGSLVVLDGCS